MKKSIYDIFRKEIILFSIGGLAYYIIEFFFKTFVSHGNTSWTMFVVGGLCFILIGGINEILPWNMLFQYQVLIGTAFVTVIEYIAGYIINIKLGMNIWDYSDLPCNLNGQICLQFIIAWIPLVGFAIWIDDILRYKLWNEELPRYHFKNRSAIKDNNIWKLKSI